MISVIRVCFMIFLISTDANWIKTFVLTSWIVLVYQQQIDSIIVSSLLLLAAIKYLSISIFRLAFSAVTPQLKFCRCKISPCYDDAWKNIWRFSLKLPVQLVASLGNLSINWYIF
ncbi:hypothetical protein SCA6_015149 [Theobroma cacao]